MRKMLKDIQTGEYAKSFILENRAGAPTLMTRRRLMAEHQIEVVGEKLRAMMPWIKKNRLVDQSTQLNRTRSPAAGLRRRLIDMLVRQVNSIPWRDCQTESDVA